MPPKLKVGGESVVVAHAKLVELFSDGSIGVEAIVVVRPASVVRGFSVLGFSGRGSRFGEESCTQLDCLVAEGGMKLLDQLVAGQLYRVAVNDWSGVELRRRVEEANRDRRAPFLNLPRQRRMAAPSGKIARVHHEVPVVARKDVPGGDAGAANEKGRSVVEHLVIVAREASLVAVLEAHRHEAFCEGHHPTRVVHQHRDPARPRPPLTSFHHRHTWQAVESLRHDTIQDALGLSIQLANTGCPRVS